jgi:hypothetical protein
MAEALPNEKLQQYLRELKPEARELLVSELERAQLRGESPPGAASILAALRSEARRDGRKLPRIGNPQRLFFAPFAPFLVDDAPERRHPGRIARVCVDPIWNWICRDLIPREARTYSDQVHLLLAANEKNGAEQVARAFQDLVEQRLRECFIATRKDEKASQGVTGQVGIPRAMETLREFAAILRARDALGVIGSRLPPTISNLAEAQLANVTALLDSPIGRHRDVFVYALLVVMSRLGSPWQLIRLAIRAAASDAAARIAETPFAVAVDVVLTDLDRMIANLRESLKAGRSEEVATLLKEIHDAARALHTEIDLSIDSPWGRQLAAARAAVAELLEGEIGNLPGQVRRLLHPRTSRETGTALDEGDVAEIEAKLVLAATCRNYASELAISEATRRVQSDLQNYFDSGTQVLLDRLRTSPPAELTFRQSQVDAAIRFCAILFGAEYASLLAKAADHAAKGEQKAANA